MPSVNNVVRTIRIRGESDGVEKVTGDLNKLAAAQQNVAVVSETSAKRVLSLEDAWKRQSLKLDEAARSQANIARESRIADGALREGLITQQQHAERLNLISQRYAIAGAATQKFTEQSGLARHELINLSRQAQDVAVSLGSGQSFGTVLLQQGSQIADVFASSGGTVRGFLGQVASGFASVLTPARVAVAAIAAVGITGVSAANAFQASQVDVQRALSGTGRAAQLTAADIGSIAEKSASLSTLSVAEAEKAAATYASTGKIYRENITTATALTHDFAKSLGVDSADAAKTLAEGLTNGIEGVDKLDQRLGFLTASQRDYLKDLDANLDKTKFQAEALRLLGANLTKASELTTSLGGAWTVAGNAVSNFWRAYGSGTAIPAAPSADKTAITGRIGAMEEDRSRIATIGGSSAAKDIAEIDTALANLRLRLTEIEGKELAAKFGAMGKSADTLTEAFTQAQTKADALERSLQVLEQARKMPEVGLTMTPEQKRRVGPAIDEARVQAMMERDLADQTERANREALRLAAAYGTGSIEVARMLDGLSRQLGVAQAVGQMAQIEAQHRARIAELSQRLSETDSRRIADSERSVALAQIESQHKQQMVALQGQLSVAEQVTGIGQINVQYEATVALLTMQIGQTKAIEQAEAQRAISIAQVNANADRMLTNLRQQGELIRAGSDEERDRISAQQTYQNLVDQGVVKSKAAAVASQQLSNAEDAREKRHQIAAEKAIAGIKTQEDAWKAFNTTFENTERRLISWSVANDEAGKILARNTQAAEDAAWWYTKLAGSIFNAANAAVLAKAAFVPFSFHAAGEPDAPFNTQMFEKNGRTTQFNPAGYKQTVATPAAIIGEQMFGRGGIDPQTGQPNAQGLEYQFNQLLTQGNFTGAIQSLLGSGLSTQSSIGVPSQLDTNKLSLLDRAIGTLPDAMQVAFKQMEVQQLGSLPESIARNEAIKTLNQSIEQLTSATNDNTSATAAMTDVLSPFYSTDPRSSHLGFRAFAGGGIMTPWGSLPLHKYDGGGIANSPQVAVFGEGRTPEAYVPVPNGRIPVEMRQPANSNQKQAPPVVVNQHFHGPVTRDTADLMKRTGFQSAQQMKRALG